jgi:flagellar FliJ protein
MKKFKFNLQRVLDYRQTLEDRLLGELGAIQAELEREHTKLANLTCQRDSFRSSMTKQLTGGSADEIKEAYAYLTQLSRQVVLQEVCVYHVEARKDRKLAEVVEASKERKVLERLKEHKVSEHRKESERQEQKSLDEMACINFARARNSEDCVTGGAA